ncbi:Kch1p ASCRUDRAFT_35694, partial [Ascoidea rubescens DSM 1968]
MLFRRNSWEWEIDNNTFDIVDLDQFKNYKFSTLWNLICSIIMNLLHVLLFCFDIYTCINLLVFNKWTNDEIQPIIPFEISRWLFSGCILLSIVLIIIDWIKGVKLYFTRNISLTYLNSVSRFLWCVKSYKYFCLYNEISPSNFFDKRAFFIFFTFKSSIALIFANTPRQVINGLTIVSIFIDGQAETVLQSLKNLLKVGFSEKYAVVLLFMFLSFSIWLIFFIEFLWALILSMFVLPKIHKVHNQSLKQYICNLINQNVSNLSRKYHKS